MAQANINDRATLAQAYPREQFEIDVRVNARAKDPVQKGVRIASPPDQEGSFELVPASRHTGELDRVSNAVFLAPFETFDAGASVPDPAEPDIEASRDRRSADAYEAFLSRIVEAARTSEFEQPIGRDADVLKGFHGG